MTSRWYVLQSKPHKEEVLWQEVQTRGFEAFYPRLHVKPANPRARSVRPYFPGYLFVRVNLKEVGLGTFQWMPCSTGLVSFGGAPGHVPDALIATIRRKLEDVEAAGGELHNACRLKPGAPVIIRDGLFAGYEAIFDARLSGSDRVRVLLKLLNERCIPLQLRAAQIERKDN
jgi:transcriptional antiterminator RfaH